jgi:WhiB family redox-sensing transcriptional regulator
MICVMVDGTVPAHEPPRLLGWGKIQPWEADANCQDAPLEWFFGDTEDDRPGARQRTRTQTALAKALCAGCPVISECREWSVVAAIPYGIFGGMTERERAAERQRRGLQIRQYTSGMRGSGIPATPSPAKVAQGTVRTSFTSVKVELWSSFQGNGQQ